MNAKKAKKEYSFLHVFADKDNNLYSIPCVWSDRFNNAVGSGKILDILLQPYGMNELEGFLTMSMDKCYSEEADDNSKIGAIEKHFGIKDWETSKGMKLVLVNWCRVEGFSLMPMKWANKRYGYAPVMEKQTELGKKPAKGEIAEAFAQALDDSVAVCKTSGAKKPKKKDRLISVYADKEDNLYAMPYTWRTEMLTLPQPYDMEALEAFLTTSMDKCHSKEPAGDGEISALEKHFGVKGWVKAEKNLRLVIVVWSDDWGLTLTPMKWKGSNPTRVPIGKRIELGDNPAKGKIAEAFVQALRTL